MIHKKTWAIYLPFFFGIFLLASCNNDSDNVEPSNSYFQVRMTDAPGNFTEVNIDIQQIKVHTDADGWMDLTTNKGVYNILEFVNGADTVLAGDSIPSGNVSQIRFVLGSNNSVVVDGQTHPLAVPSGSQSGLKLNLHQNLTPGITHSVLIDFDAAQSIVLTGNGEYKLKPVLKVIAEGIDGAIKGDLEPDGVYTSIMAIKGNQMHGAVADSAGNFLVNGLEQGTYMLCILPMVPYKNDTIYSVQVNTGVVTDMGQINLQQ